MGLLRKDRDLTVPPEEVELVVDASDFRVKAKDLVLRLDQFLGEHLTWRSRSSLQRLVKEGYVYVDASTPDHPDGRGRPERERRPGRKLRHGSRVVVVIPEESRIAAPTGPASPLSILYEDEEVLVVDKPPLVAVHPSGRHLVDTLIQRVHAHFRDEIASGAMTPRLCHRLDRETSGLVLVAKHPRTHPALMGQFESREVEKSYLALTWGRPARTHGLVDEPIGTARASAVRLKVAVRADGLPSRTGYEVVESVGDVSLVRCDLYTGRQHQIRVHLAWLGCPIVGDKLYGSDEGCFTRAAAGELTDQDRARLGMERQALHHQRLVFTSPARREPVVVESPLAGDMERWLRARSAAGVARPDHA